MVKHPDNPFLRSQYGQWLGSCTVEDRIRDVAQFTLADCHKALALTDLQRTVITALNRRIRNLENRK